MSNRIVSAAGTLLDGDDRFPQAAIRIAGAVVRIGRFRYHQGIWPDRKKFKGADVAYRCGVAVPIHWSRKAALVFVIYRG